MTEQEKLKKQAEGCELKQQGTNEVWYCPVHVSGMEKQSGDPEINDMVNYQENK